MALVWVEEPIRGGRNVTPLLVEAVDGFVLLQAVRTGLRKDVVEGAVGGIPVVTPDGVPAERNTHCRNADVVVIPDAMRTLASADEHDEVAALESWANIRTADTP